MELVSVVDGYGQMLREHIVLRAHLQDSSTSATRALCGRRNNHWLSAPGAVHLAEAEGTVEGECRQCAKQAAYKTTISS